MKKKKTCSICNKKHEAKGYCKSHYKSLVKYGDPLQVDRNNREREARQKAKQDLLKEGAVLTSRGNVRVVEPRDGECSVTNCGEPIKARRLCEKHYARMRRTGHPVPVKCFGCYDGKPEEYVDEYAKLENDVIECSDCGLRVRYEQQEAGKWVEILV